MRIETGTALDFNAVHYFTFDDLSIILDVNSGSVHVADEDTLKFWTW